MRTKRAGSCVFTPLSLALSPMGRGKKTHAPLPSPLPDGERGTRGQKKNGPAHRRPAELSGLVQLLYFIRPNVAPFGALTIAQRPPGKSFVAIISRAPRS